MLSIIQRSDCGLALAVFVLFFSFSLFQRSAAASPVIYGMEAIEDTLPVYDADEGLFRDPHDGDEFAPMRVLLSRSRYWADDGHLDVVVRLDADGDYARGTEIEVRFFDGSDKELSVSVITPACADFIFYPSIPEALQDGGEGVLELEWRGEDGEVRSVLREEFRVAREPVPAGSGGTISLHVPNDGGAIAKNVPVTAGVPFPRGALYDISRLRLIATDGSRRYEVPVQVSEVGRWSRYGSVKWVHCDFTVDLPGTSREFELEYGAGVGRSERDPILVEEGECFPLIEAGRFRFDSGLWYDAGGEGDYVQVLDEGGLFGGFVEHEDGRIYRMGAEGSYVIEESGPEKVVLRREDWYVEESEGREFCKYVTRYIIHRDSPFIRIFHSWIFTGDGNHDRIRNMGWEFSLPAGFEGTGFLTGFGEEGSWVGGDYLLQHDYDHFEVFGDGVVTDFRGGRAAGAARVSGGGLDLYFGARDFWQNYPSELEFRDGSFWYHSWPRHNRPARYSFAGEMLTDSGDAALPSAARHEHYDPEFRTRSEWKLNTLQARFAHEGEVLDFRLPDELAEDPIWDRSSRSGGSVYWSKGEPESANAQGISRTEEMWLYVSEEDGGEDYAAGVLEGLNEETMRVVVDPEWMASSGAFYEMHHRDPENYPEQERIYELVALSPARIAEHLGIYGMWIYGDLPAWNPRMETREPDLYRAYRKRHHGWPYTWKTYARSGDSRLFRIADASTRQLIDTGWCHYSDEEVDRLVGARFQRNVGLIRRSTLPWAGTRVKTRSYESQSDFLWRAWYLAGYHRAKDALDDWSELVRVEEPVHYRGPIPLEQRGRRVANTLLKSFLEMWEATFDPWFLVAAHTIAEGFVDSYRSGEWGGRLWETGEREFLRYTGEEGDLRDYYMEEYVAQAVSESEPDGINRRKPHFPPKAYAWKLTGDEYYLRRIVNGIKFGTFMVRDGAEPDYYQGYIRRDGGGYTLFTPYYLRWFPVGLWALEEAGYMPDAIPNLFAVYPQKFDGEEHGHRLGFAFHKEEGRALPMTLGAFVRHRRPARGRERADYAVTGPDGEEVLSGSWQIRERTEIEVPAGAPAGTYRLELLYERGVNRLEFDVPVSAADIPEVIDLSGEEGSLEVYHGRGGHLGWSQGQYYFYVPEDAGRFGVDFSDYVGAAVWGPDGGRIWNQADYYDDQEGRYRAEIEVEPGLEGRIWRITMPAGGFRMDPEIPPFYSLNRTRWFDPGGAD